MTHEACDIKCRQEVHTATQRQYKSLPKVECSFHANDILATTIRRPFHEPKKTNISTDLAG